MSVVRDLNSLYSEMIERKTDNTGSCICTNRGPDKCGFRELEEACYWPFIGEEKSKCIVVAEAPSTRGKRGTGIHLSRSLDKVAKLPPDKRNTWDKFIHVLRDILGYFPHFTDAVKCGVSKQKRTDKYDILHDRFDLQNNGESIEDRCSYYLLEEIRIVRPSLIISVGNFAQQKVETIKNRTGINFDHKHILHYSKQASLPVSIDDKVNIIWPMQLMDYLPAEFKIPEFSKLSYLNK